MQLSDGEKIIIIMLNRISEHLKVTEMPFNAELLQKALLTGNQWAIAAEIPDLATPPIDQGTVSDVLRILSMWAKIEEVEGESFPGFDDNREPQHLSVAYFATEVLDRFPGFKGRIGNGFNGLPGYRRMLEVFDQLPVGDRKLDPQEMHRLMEARDRPN